LGDGANGNNLVDDITLPCAGNADAIRRHHADLFSTMRGIWRLGMQVLEPDRRVGVGKSQQLAVLLFGIYAKQMRSFMSMYRLCFDGMGIEAEAHVRALFTVRLYLLALDRAQNSNEFARLWVVWCFANHDKAVRGISHLKVMVRPEGHAAWIEEERKAFGAKWNNFVRLGPALKDLASLAKDLGIEDQYRVFYPSASGGAHGYDIVKFIQPGADKTIIRLGPHEDTVIESLTGGSLFLVDSLTVINKQLNAGKDDVIAQMVRTLDEFNERNPLPDDA
jgi:Family of unknown function (DUF5677)